MAASAASGAGFDKPGAKANTALKLEEACQEANVLFEIVQNRSYAAIPANKYKDCYRLLFETFDQKKEEAKRQPKTKRDPHVLKDVYVGMGQWFTCWGNHDDVRALKAIGKGLVCLSEQEAEWRKKRRDAIGANIKGTMSNIVSNVKGVFPSLSSAGSHSDCDAPGSSGGSTEQSGPLCSSDSE